MPTLAITVTSEVIKHANDIIQEGRGVMVLAHRQGRWELLPHTPCTDEEINQIIRSGWYAPVYPGNGEPTKD